MDEEDDSEEDDDDEHHPLNINGGARTAQLHARTAKIKIRRVRTKKLRYSSVKYSTLTVNMLPMLRLLFSKAQECKDLRKSSKPCHVVIH